jgi:predicted nucleic acid-binding protein
LVVAALDQPASRRAAELRAGYRLRPAGAWQVAACREQGATASLSNDRDLRRLTDLPVWMLEDFV